jgi:hypothetical protein
MHTLALPEHHVPAVFSHKFGSLIKSVLGGYDRLRFRGTLRPLFSPKWMRGYLCAAKILLKDFARHAQQVSQQIGERPLKTASGARPEKDSPEAAAPIGQYLCGSPSRQPTAPVATLKT